MPADQNRLNTLDLLRTFAALAVCAFHLRWSEISWITDLFGLGYLGVDVFFCISGFITPLALSWGKFKISKTPGFLLSRFIRLYPAFVIIALAEMALYYFGCPALGYGAHPDRITWERVLANLTLTADFFQIEWYVAVFWTLAIEAQFYLMILICYPLLNSKKLSFSLPVLIVWCALPLLVGKGPTLGTYSALFAMGMAAYLLYQKRISHWLYLCLLILATVIEAHAISERAAITALGTALAITYLPPFTGKVVEWFSKLSYSFFLIHITIGGAFMYNFKHLPPTWHYQLPTLIGATLVATLVAFAYYRFIELPIHNYSRKLKKRKLLSQ